MTERDRTSDATEDATAYTDLDEELELVGEETVDDSSRSAEEETVHTVDEPFDGPRDERAEPA